ncbi:MAG TPA: bifunctional hydroxymethylpyrimidine kinase/phosphomethylpyrimidine kinase [Vicinamibacterales bacterium]|nr:bifunctional hydroxymethylpyrimidine kinase/phosphomethylpyrimidine kinase [Vicinamibacterales bacterium]
MRTALTIAGSDSGGGAGIQADLKTFAAHGVFGLSAVTAITAQNTLGVSASAALDPALVTAQVDAVAADLPIHAVKIGMLANRHIIAAVADALVRHGLGPVVLDPVMLAKGGARLLADDAVAALRHLLLPLATLVTPNTEEAATLAGRPVRTLVEARSAAEIIRAAGARAVLVKGGHLDGPAIDVLADGAGIVEFRQERVETRHTHGTGCTLSSAIAARLAHGDDLRTAIASAKSYVTRAILQAPGLGHGHGPLNHFPT